MGKGQGNRANKLSLQDLDLLLRVYPAWQRTGDWQRAATESRERKESVNWALGKIAQHIKSDGTAKIESVLEEEWERLVGAYQEFRAATVDLRQRSQGGKNRVSIIAPGTVITALLPRILAPFLKDNPTARLHVDEGYTHEVMDAVQRKMAHIGIAPNAHDDDAEKAHPKLAWKLINSARRVLVGRRDYPFIGRNAGGCKLQHLKRETMFVLPRLPFFRLEKHMQVPPNPRWHVMQHVDQMLPYVRLGLGMAVVGEDLVSDGDPELAKVPIEEFRDESPARVYYYYRKDYESASLFTEAESKLHEHLMAIDIPDRITG